ncbi:MAG: hypothetical protein HY301_08065 [Verrucomicrobia bacterium]|nr:hypothetical protein [Verrucomicrobiota bacterium]
MQMLCAILCDYAADYSGKLAVMGAFDTIMAQQFPVTHAHCSIAIRVLFNDTDEGKHKFSIKLIDSDGRNVLPKLEPEIQVKLAEEMFLASHNFVINLQGLKFDKPGQYSIDVSYDGEIVSRVPLQVIEMKKPAA